MKQKLTCCDAGYRRLKPGDRIFDGDEYWCGHPDAGFWAFTGDVGRKLGCNDLVYRRRDPVYRERILVCDDCACGLETGKEMLANFLKSAVCGQDPWVGKVICTTSERTPATNPGPAPEYGWRLLRPGEIVVDGDRESFVGENSWHPFDDAGPRNITVKHGRFERRIEPGEGYRLLTVGEKIEAGDELYDDGAWIPRDYSIGDKFEKGMLATRRTTRVDPGAGYRLLAVGEIIRQGDEGKDIYKGWTLRGCFVNLEQKDWMTPTRRKLVTEKSYRLLRVGEVIQLTDEVYHLVKHKWDSVSNHSYLKVVNADLSPIRREMELAYVGGPA